MLSDVGMSQVQSLSIRSRIGEGRKFDRFEVRGAERFDSQ